MAKLPPLWHYQAMNSALILILGTILLLVGTGALIAYFGIRSAPVGYEGDDGFHSIETPKPLKPASVAIEPASGTPHDDPLSLAA